MPTVVGVRFKDSGKTYHFDPRDVHLAVGDWAIVETVRGPELGRIAESPRSIPVDQLFGDLKPVLRRATQGDLDHLAHLQQYLDDALAICAEKVAEHNLPMQLVKAEYNFDGSRLTFFFTSEKRVDFRSLVRDLARTFQTRIELRQVGPRDEAKLLGGLGPCGRPLCCSTFLPDFARVSIKMAKDQDLPLNPVKISGVCGRLLCCLSYEHEQYLDIKGELPSRGAWVQTAEGPGEVMAVNVVRETVTVELTNGNTIDCTAAQILEVTTQVAAEARARNAEGITPVARGRSAMVADADADIDVDVLAALEDAPPPPPPMRLEAALAPTGDRGTPSRRSEERAARGRERRREGTPPPAKQANRAQPSAGEQRARQKPSTLAPERQGAPSQHQQDAAQAGRSSQRRRRRNRGNEVK